MINSLTGALGLSVYDASFWMPLVMVGLLFVVTVAAVVLDGFDIGVGCLLFCAPDSVRMRMLALLSPWRDANEFWLLLGLGLLVAAFPHAWSPLMAALYLPLSMLAVGVLLRSASFELRLRAPQEWQHVWTMGFALGSVFTAMAHGLIISKVVTAYASGWIYGALGVFFAVCAVAAYALLGASWLVMREAGELRARAVMWARRTVRWVAAGAVAVSLVLVLANTGVLLKWGELPDWRLVAAVWIALLVCFVVVEMTLQRMINGSLRTTAVPFVFVLLIFFIILLGLAYSFFPYLILDDVTVWDAAASTSSLRWVLSAAIVALPVAIVFNVWVYWGMFGLSRPPELPAYSVRHTPSGS